jgi:hypothetical protein
LVFYFPRLAGQRIAQCEDGDITDYLERGTAQSEVGDITDYLESRTAQSEDGDVTEYLRAGQPSARTVTSLIT